jgi:methionine-rich copper-binding protein CopC
MVMNSKQVYIIIAIIAVIGIFGIFFVTSLIAAPEVKNTTPQNNTTSNSNSSDIKVAFTENILEGVNYHKISVVELNTKLNVTIASKTIVGDTLTIKTQPRKNNTWYKVTIPLRAVKDKDSRTFNQTYYFIFKTA